MVKKYNIRLYYFSPHVNIINSYFNLFINYTLRMQFSVIKKISKIISRKDKVIFSHSGIIQPKGMNINFLG